MWVCTVLACLLLLANSRIVVCSVSFSIPFARKVDVCDLEENEVETDADASEVFSLQNLN